LDGTMVMSGFYETVNPKTPGIDFKMDINNFDIQKTAKTFVTVQKMAPVAEKCFGKFSTSMSIAGTLDEKMEPVMNTLNGEGRLSTAGVVVQNFEPVNKMAEALKMDHLKKLTMNDVKLAFKFENGKINVEPFDVKMGNITANIKGSSGFDQSIDYTWALDIPRSEFGGAANAVLNNLVSQVNAKGVNFTPGERIKVDVLIGGTVSEPTVKTNLKESASNAVNDLKGLAKEKFDEKKAELEAKAKEEAERLKKEAEAKARAEADKLKGEADKAKAEAEAKARAEQERLKAEAEKAKKEAEDKAKKEAEKKLKGFVKP
jgi:hypothetical protein